MNDTPTVKRPRGRPRKNPLPGVEREAVREPVSSKKFKMRAAPNWEAVDPSATDSPDRLKIDPALIPEGMSAQWVTDSVLGQGMPQHRSKFERKGWTPVHQDDFDGQFNGLWMPKDAPGEVNNGGQVLMMRPKEMSLKAEREDKRRARLQVEIKEAALTGGDLPGVSLDPNHPSARNSNRIRKTREQIEIPE